jgi:hypothetical protein
VSLDHPVRVGVTLLVYGGAIVLGGGVLVLDPVGTVTAVPLVAGVVLPAHALRRGRLDELGEAVVGLWVAVLALSVGAGLLDVVLRGRTLPPLSATPVVRVGGTLGLLAVLVALYGVRSASAGR